jgi:urate oxidase
MPVTLAGNNYGKSRVRVMKVTRYADRHDLAELSVNIQFEGDFDPVHLAGDNAAVLPTDTMKNTVNALAKEWSGEQIEDFGRQLVEHFLEGNPQVSSVRIEIAQCQWARLDRHAFVEGSQERRTTNISATRGSLAVQSGIENLVILKTAGSGFEGYKKDRYTTLKETGDRILATAVRADWKYSVPDVAYGPSRQRARNAMLKTFVEQDSPSVQHTAYAMGAAALEAAPEIAEIRLSLPNKHCLLVDLSLFGMENRNEIFVPVDEPYGLIEVLVKRE